MVGHGLVGKTGQSATFSKTWDPGMQKKPVSQVPMSCVFHSGMFVIKESEKFVKIKAV
jgi:hypothetical protein